MQRKWRRRASEVRRATYKKRRGCTSSLPCAAGARRSRRQCAQRHAAACRAHEALSKSARALLHTATAATATPCENASGKPVCSTRAPSALQARRATAGYIPRRARFSAQPVGSMPSYACPNNSCAPSSLRSVLSLARRRLRRLVRDGHHRVAHAAHAGQEGPDLARLTRSSSGDGLRSVRHCGSGDAAARGCCRLTHHTRSPSCATGSVGPFSPSRSGFCPSPTGRDPWRRGRASSQAGPPWSWGIASGPASRRVVSTVTFTRPPLPDRHLHRLTACLVASSAGGACEAAGFAAR